MASSWNMLSDVACMQKVHSRLCGGHARRPTCAVCPLRIGGVVRRCRLANTCWWECILRVLRVAPEQSALRPHGATTLPHT